MKKVGKRMFFVLFLIGTMILIGINVFSSWYDKDQRVYDFYKDSNVKTDIFYTNVNTIKVRNIFSSISPRDSTKPLLVFIHGAPGAGFDFKGFSKDTLLLNVFDVLIIDRVGYGGSEIDKNKYSIIEQGELIIKQLEKFNHRELVLVGHSYGGPIASYMAVELKGRIKSVVLIAPVMDPENEVIFLFSPWAKYAPLKWVLPKEFEVASYEKMDHAVDLKNSEPYLSKIDCRVLHVHGLEDGLAPIVNIDYIKSHINNEYLEQVILEDAGHMLPWLNYDMIRDLLINENKGI